MSIKNCNHSCSNEFHYQTPCFHRPIPDCCHHDHHRHYTCHELHTCPSSSKEYRAHSIYTRYCGDYYPAIDVRSEGFHADVETHYSRSCQVQHIAKRKFRSDDREPDDLHRSEKRQTKYSDSRSKESSRSDKRDSRSKESSRSDKSDFRSKDDSLSDKRDSRSKDDSLSDKRDSRSKDDSLSDKRDSRSKDDSLSDKRDSRSKDDSLSDKRDSRSKDDSCSDRRAGEASDSRATEKPSVSTSEQIPVPEQVDKEQTRSAKFTESLKNLVSGLDNLLKNCGTSSEKVDLSRSLIFNEPQKNRSQKSRLPVGVLSSSRPKLQDNGLFSPGSDRLRRKAPVIETAPLVKVNPKIQRWRDPRIEGYKNTLDNPQQKSKVQVTKDPTKTPQVSFFQILNEVDASQPGTEEMFETILKSNIDSGLRVIALHKLGNARMKSYLKNHSLDVLEKAIESYRTGINLPNISKAYKAMFYLNLGKAYLTRKRVGDLDLAINAFSEGLKLDRQNPKNKTELERCFKDASVKKANLCLA